jgi:hypothetical protein
MLFLVFVRAQHLNKLCSLVDEGLNLVPVVDLLGHHVSRRSLKPKPTAGVGGSRSVLAGLRGSSERSPRYSRTHMTGDDERENQDERLLARAEATLTEIKVTKGLSEPHAAVLAALRIRLKGDAGKSLEDMLAAAEDPDGSKLDEVIERAQTKPSTSFDDLLSKEDKPKRSLDDLLG